MHSLGSKAHFWDRFASPKPLKGGNPRKRTPRPSSSRPPGSPTPVPSHSPQGRMVGSYSLCRTARTAQCWERGSQEVSITVHVSLLALKACWPVEQKLSKKETLTLAVLHSACSDSRGSAPSPRPGTPEEHPAPAPGKLCPSPSHPSARDAVSIPILPQHQGCCVHVHPCLSARDSLSIPIPPYCQGCCLCVHHTPVPGMLCPSTVPPQFQGCCVWVHATPVPAMLCPCPSSPQHQG